MILLLAVAAYLALSPVPIEPVVWHAPASIGFTGAYAANTRLASASHIDLGGETGPETVTPGPDGRIWLGLAGRRNAIDRMDRYPFLRRMVLRIPRALWPAPPSYGHVIAFTEDGAVVASLQDPSGRSPSTTGATETAAGLVIQSIDGAGLGWLKPTPDADR